MSQLNTLPIELLIVIAESLPGEKDLVAFVQTNKRTYAVLQSSLYKNHIHYHGTWALLWAAQHGFPGLATKILEAGGSIGGFDDCSHAYHHNPGGGIRRVGNPLALAAKGCHIETLKVLLAEKRPEKTYKPAQLCGALHQGAFVSHCSEAVELLIQHGAALGPLTSGFNSYPSALSGAVQSHFHSIIPILLQADARVGDSETPSPLERAISTNQSEVVDILLEAGHLLTDDKGLRSIAENGNQDLMKTFIDRGLDVEMCWQGALFVAIMHGQTEMVELLIEKGANPHLTHDVMMLSWDCCRCSTIGFAVQFNQMHILKLLLQRGVRPGKEDLDLAYVTGLEDAMLILKEYSLEDTAERQHISDFIDKKVLEKRRQDPEFQHLRIASTLFDPLLTRELEEAELGS